MWGLAHSRRVTVPDKVAGLLTSNSPANGGCAVNSTRVTPASNNTPIITCFMRIVVHLSRGQVDAFRRQQPARVAREDHRLVGLADLGAPHRRDSRTERRDRAAVAAEEDAVGAEHLRRQR